MKKLAKPTRPDPSELDFSHLVTEDGEPVDNQFSEMQMRLLANQIASSWPFPDRPKMMCTNVGLFSETDAVMAPDVMLAIDVQPFPASLRDKKKRGRSYFMRLYGKAPDVVIEIVSNDQGGEMEKVPRYARLGVRYAVLFDPRHYLSTHTLRAFTLRPDGTAHESRARTRFWMPRVGLGLTLWQGRFEGDFDTWLRWCDRRGEVLPTGDETTTHLNVENASLRTFREADRLRAEQAERAAEASDARSARYAKMLAELGVDLEPETE